MNGRTGTSQERVENHILKIRRRGNAALDSKQYAERGLMSKTKTVTGFTLGTVVAVALSWSVNKSILWAILHGFLSWLYVIYYFVTQ